MSQEGPKIALSCEGCQFLEEVRRQDIVKYKCNRVEVTGNFGIFLKIDKTEELKILTPHEDCPYAVAFRNAVESVYREGYISITNYISENITDGVWKITFDANGVIETVRV